MAAILLVISNINSSILSHVLKFYYNHESKFLDLTSMPEESILNSFSVIVGTSPFTFTEWAAAESCPGALTISFAGNNTTTVKE